MFWQDHAKDAEFLSQPIINYGYMQTIFGCGVATGRFAMGSNEALKQPHKQEFLDLETEPTTPTLDEATPSQKDKKDGKKDQKKEDKKRKRIINEEDAAVMTGMTDAIWGLNAAVSEGNHSEVAPGIYEAVMGCKNLSRPDLMICLNYLMKHKGASLVFLSMSDEDKELWCKTHLDEKFSNK